MNSENIEWRNMGLGSKLCMDEINELLEIEQAIEDWKELRKEVSVKRKEKIDKIILQMEEDIKQIKGLKVKIIYNADWQEETYPRL